MTSLEQNNHVLENTEVRESFENLTAVCAIKEIAKGSIIFKLVCPSIKSLFGFWKGCTYGTVVQAMSRIRDAYRKHLGCNTLEFDIVLKKKEVTRCKIKISKNMFLYYHIEHIFLFLNVSSLYKNTMYVYLIIFP